MTALTDDSHIRLQASELPSLNVVKTFPLFQATRFVVTISQQAKETNVYANSQGHLYEILHFFYDVLR